MIYDIQSKSDFLTGATLTVLIPEEELDRKALYTIQADMPCFILPFRSRSVDGKMELVYQIGRYSKLQYVAGTRRPREYAQMWTGVLDPLVNCGDWFMKPYSFALSAEYLYYDKDKNSIRYVYIPTLSDCADYGDMKEMAAEVSKLIPVTDAALENRVLKAIMKNFNPQEFLKMLRAYMEEDLSAETPPRPPVEPGVRGAPHMIQASYAPHTQQAMYAPLAMHTPQAMQSPNATHASCQPQAAQSPNAMHTSYPPHAAQSPNIPVTSYPPGAPPALNAPQAHVLPQAHMPPHTSPTAPGDVFINVPTNRMFSKKNKGSKENKDNRENKESMKSEKSHITAPPPARPAVNEEPVYTIPEEINDATQSIETAAVGARLSYVGRGQLPPVIYVPIKQGEVFTVGRFDAAVGRAQSSFEFEKKTKAVSRRHAAIEHCAEGFRIIDLTSSAGTFLNGKKLPPNTPVGLEHGCRVSFGNSGADYIWESA